MKENLYVDFAAILKEGTDVAKVVTEVVKDQDSESYLNYLKEDIKSALNILKTQYKVIFITNERSSELIKSYFGFYNSIEDIEVIDLLSGLDDCSILDREDFVATPLKSLKSELVLYAGTVDDLVSSSIKGNLILKCSDMKNKIIYPVRRGGMGFTRSVGSWFEALDDMIEERC